MLVFLTLFLVTQPSASIEGRLLDGDPQPLPGLRISLSGTADRTTGSEADGRFRFTDLASGRYTLVGETRDGRVAERTVTLSPGQRLELDLIVAPTVRERTVVWGTRVSNSSTYLGDSDIALVQVDHLSDLLRDQPGVEVGGTHSTNQRINIRGLDDTDLTVTIDGANQNAFMYHHMGNLLINADILKKVDLDVGAQSVVYGGLGGAARFETKDARELLAPGRSAGVRLSAGYFTNEAAIASVTTYARLGGSVDLLAYGYFTDRDNPEDGAGVENIGNDGEIADLLVKTGFDLGLGGRLELSLGNYRDEGEYTQRPDMGAATNLAIPGSVGPFPTEYGRLTNTLNYELDPSEALSLRATLYHNDLELERDETISGGAIESGTATNTGLTLTGRSHARAGSIDHDLVYGVDLSLQEAQSARNGIDLSNEESTNTALFLEDRLLFGNGFELTPGIRYDRYAADTATLDETYDELTGALALGYQISPELRLYGGGKQLFKGPEMAEIFRDGAGGKIPNPDLIPETGNNIEAGFRYNKSAVLGADHVAFAVNAFRTRIEDRIEQITITRGVVQDQNIGTVDIDGYEISFHYLLDPFTALLTYSTSDSEVQETGNPLEREIGDSLSLSLGYTFADPAWTFNWRSQLIEDEDHVAAGGEPKEGYQVHELSLRWQPGGRLRGLSATFGIDNIFDEHYVSHASRTGSTVHPVFGALVLNDYEPGRNIKLTLAHTF